MSLRANMVLPDLLMPDQFFHRRRISPERQLVIEVLTSALDDIVKGDIRGRVNLHAREAICWIKSDSDTPFSFKWCCEVSNVPADRFRSKILSGATQVHRAIRRFRKERAGTRRMVVIEE